MAGKKKKDKIKTMAKPNPSRRFVDYGNAQKSFEQDIITRTSGTGAPTVSKRPKARKKK